MPPDSPGEGRRLSNQLQNEIEVEEKALRSLKSELLGSGPRETVGSAEVDFVP